MLSPRFSLQVQESTAKTLLSLEHTQGKDSSFLVIPLAGDVSSVSWSDLETHITLPRNVESVVLIVERPEDEGIAADEEWFSTPEGRVALVRYDGESQVRFQSPEFPLRLSLGANPDPELTSIFSTLNSVASRRPEKPVVVDAVDLERYLEDQGTPDIIRGGKGKLYFPLPLPDGFAYPADTEKLLAASLDQVNSQSSVIWIEREGRPVTAFAPAGLAYRIHPSAGGPVHYQMLNKGASEIKAEDFGPLLLNQPVPLVHRALKVRPGLDASRVSETPAKDLWSSIEDRLASVVEDEPVVYNEVLMKPRLVDKPYVDALSAESSAWDASPPVKLEPESSPDVSGNADTSARYGADSFEEEYPAELMDQWSTDAERSTQDLGAHTSGSPGPARLSEDAWSGLLNSEPPMDGSEPQANEEFADHRDFESSRFDHQSINANVSSVPDSSGRRPVEIASSDQVRVAPLTEGQINLENWDQKDIDGYRFALSLLRLFEDSDELDPVRDRMKRQFNRYQQHSPLLGSDIRRAKAWIEQLSPHLSHTVRLYVGGQCFYGRISGAQAQFVDGEATPVSDRALERALRASLGLSGEEQAPNTSQGDWDPERTESETPSSPSPWGA